MLALVPQIDGGFPRLRTSKIGDGLVLPLVPQIDGGFARPGTSEIGDGLVLVLVAQIDGGFARLSTNILRGDVCRTPPSIIWRRGKWKATLCFLRWSRKLMVVSF